MKVSLALASLLLAGCSLVARGDPTADTPVGVQSHNVRDVDVYLLCGSRDALWLGTVPKQGSAEYAISRKRRLCAAGLNFFLVIPTQGLGYWVGPIRPQASSHVRLVIEKYAGVSSASLMDVLP